MCRTSSYFAARLRRGIGLRDSLVAVTEHPVVIGVGQLVQHHGRLMTGPGQEIPRVADLHGPGLLGIEVVLLQPLPGRDGSRRTRISD